MILSSFLTLLLVSVPIDASKILVMFGFPGKSHVGAFMPFVEELVKRGHEVTVLTAIPRKKPLANYTELLVADTLKTGDHEDFSMFDLQNVYYVPMLFFFFHMSYNSCERLLQEPNMQKLIHSNDQQFDLVIYEPFFTECTYGILHKFKAPTIQIFPNTIIPLMGNAVGNPSTTSHITDMIMDADVSTFWGRLLNFVRVGYGQLFRKFYMIPKMDNLMRKYFPDPNIPSIEELEKNTSFLFLHSHPLIHSPRPLTPNTIEVAGLHITGAKKLPQDLKNFIDGASQGVIYFSLGSNLRSVDMPESMRIAILKTFSKLKQKVLWKWETDHLPGKPANVMLSQWFPQHDILAHPNIKLFITHGGLMSMQEATYFGVPLIAIPVLAEQYMNAITAQNAGYARCLKIENITEETLSWTIQEILTNPSYHENVRRRSAIFKDQPLKPLDRAVFWTEYTIRHKGAPHLRSAALQLNVYQYYLLDVIAVILAIGLTLASLLFFCIKMIIRCLCSKSRSATQSQTKKNN